MCMYIYWTLNQSNQWKKIGNLWGATAPQPPSPPIGATAFFDGMLYFTSALYIHTINDVIHSIVPGNPVSAITAWEVMASGLVNLGSARACVTPAQGDSHMQSYRNPDRLVVHAETASGDEPCVQPLWPMVVPYRQQTSTVMWVKLLFKNSNPWSTEAWSQDLCCIGPDSVEQGAGIGNKWLELSCWCCWCQKGRRC